MATLWSYLVDVTVWCLAAAVAMGALALLVSLALAGWRVVSKALGKG